MRIGEVAKKYNLSIDTLHFYIRYGLLVPPKKNGQYEFDAGTEKELGLVLKFKSLGFSLKEIHHIISIVRVSRLAGKEDIEDLKHMYKTRIETLEAEKLKISNDQKILAQTILDLDALAPSPPAKTGLPLSMISYLRCPICHKELLLDNIRMNQRYIFDGDLQCLCGYQANISEGILITPNKNSSIYDKPDVERKKYKSLPSELISVYQQSYNWMSNKLSATRLSGKVILETYINAYCFLHNHQTIIPDDAQIIIIDKFPETLQVYKSLIERQVHCPNILYIADAGLVLPLKENVVDINIDFFSSNEHHFYHHSCWLNHLYPYLKENALSIGTYFYFNNGSKSIKKFYNEYPESYHHSFNLNRFLQELSASGYQMLDSGDMEFCMNTKQSLGLPFYAEGEKMCLMPYMAMKK